MSYLREYQTGAMDAFLERIAAKEENRLAVELATGLGKTVTGAALAALQDGALIFTHTEEITDQWEEKLAFAVRQAGFPLSIGVVKGGRDDYASDLVIASVPTVGNNPERLARLGRRGFNIADEAHHAVAPSWTRSLEHAGAWDGVPTLGLSATLARSDGAGLGHVWQDLVFSRGITWAQRKGYLLDVVPWRVRVPDVSASASDAALDAMLADGIAPEAVVETWLEKAAGLSTVVFAPLVKSAEAFRDAFRDKGIRAEVVHGKQGARERAAILKDYAAGRVTVLCNAMALTEGWDSPRTMCIVWARPTTSKPLFIQGIGRGLRPWLDAGAPPREDQRCILLLVTDPSGAGLVTPADLSDRPLELQDGKSLLEMEDEYDLAAGLLDNEPQHYRGPVRVEEWDLAVQASTKAWKFTEAGAPFLPTAKRSAGYVFVVGSEVWAYMPNPKNPRKYGAKRMAMAPDSSLAMAVAEDVAMDLGGDVGALLADKSRPWRKAVPSVEMVQGALRDGVPQREVDRILALKASGKAGKLSDLRDRVRASQLLDPIIQRIQERA